MHCLIFSTPCSLISNASCIWFCYSHPGWHRQTSHFVLYLSLPMTFMCAFVGTLQVSSKNFSWSRKEKLSVSVRQTVFSSWRRSSRGNSQMMTAIVKGQISPCGFASDCMFISFWSGRDSKPLSHSPHSPNSWSSACHWNRLRDDPGDRGKVAVCHITSVLVEKTSFAAVLCHWLTSFFLWFVLLCSGWTHGLRCHISPIKKSKSIALPRMVVWAYFDQARWRPQHKKVFFLVKNCIQISSYSMQGYREAYNGINWGHYEDIWTSRQVITELTYCRDTQPYIFTFTSTGYLA